MVQVASGVQLIPGQPGAHLQQQQQHPGQIPQQPGSSPMQQQFGGSKSFGGFSGDESGMA